MVSASPDPIIKPKDISIHTPKLICECGGNSFMVTLQGWESVIVKCSYCGNFYTTDDLLEEAIPYIEGKDGILVEKYGKDN